MMEIVTTITDLQASRKQRTGSVGLVPTMGYLHAGHLALVARAVQENERTIASIFVNPIQFGAGEDLARYPRSPDRDLGMLRQAGIDLVFMPGVSEMYPRGFQTSVEVGEIGNTLEGASRPGHFRGVATVVSKLFNLTQPDRAYFGQKDAQQVAVIQRMARDLNFPLELVIVPTVRETDGLALSSRNVYLSRAERAAAPILYKALRIGQAAYTTGQRDANQIRAAVRDVTASEPLAQIEYVSVADRETFAEQHGILSGSALIVLAVRFGSTRLIDNWPLT